MCTELTETQNTSYMPYMYSVNVHPQNEKTHYANKLFLLMPLCFVGEEECTYNADPIDSKTTSL